MSASITGPAVLLVAHGSKSEAGRREMGALRDTVAAVAPYRRVELGYLEMCDPPAGEVLDDLVAEGPSMVVVVPLMLNAAGHAKSDVPAVVLHGRDRHPGVTLRYARPMGAEPALLALAGRRLEEAGAAGLPLGLVARGTSDPDANGEAYKVARLVADRSGAGLVAPGFSGLTWPDVPGMLDQLRMLGATRVATFAWYLATVVLIERMQRQYRDFAAATGIEVVDAGYLGPDPVVAGVILDRIAEAASGSGAVSTNCDLCVHRAPWPGLEDQVGKARGVGHSHLAADHLHGHRHDG